MSINVESVRIRHMPRPAAGIADTPEGSVVGLRKGARTARLWAWIVCPTVFLLSYVAVLNLFARGVLIAFMAWFLVRIAFDRRSLRVTAPIVSYLAWGFFALLVSAFALDLDLALRKWLTIFSVGLMSLAVYNAVLWSGSIRPWAWAFIVSAMLAYISNYLPIERYLIVEYDTERLGRYVGTLGNANEFGSSMTNAFLVGLGLIAFRSRGPNAQLAILSMGVLGLAVIESSSRTAMLGLGVGVVAFYHSIKPRDLLTPINFAALGSVIAAIFVVFFYFPVRFEAAITRMRTFFSFLGITDAEDTGERSIDHRLELALRAFKVSIERPLGIGLDNFRILMGTYSHSNYLEILVSSGFLGFLLYYSGFVFLAIRSLRPVMARPNSISSTRYMLWALSAFAVMDAFNVTYYSKVFWIFVAILAATFELLRANEIRAATHGPAR